ncbi:hypothetical protein BKA61DRAFT_481495, partial [Leptodontidium sp. MPI-SDFR-AT-0119]
VTNKLFTISPNVVITAFREAVNSANINKFKFIILVNITKGVGECFAKCGIKKR